MAPLLTFEVQPPKGVLAYVPLAVAVLLILAPHPSYVIMLASHYLKTSHAPLRFCTHLLAVHMITFFAFSSLIVCVVRDPGPVTFNSNKTREDENENEVLLAVQDDGEEHVPGAGRWCRVCRQRRPERAHHCSTCARCVLKMDHHCPWLGGNCVGHRTYPSFLHFILCTTLLAAYMTAVSLAVLAHLISDPFAIDPRVSPLHALFLVLMGAVFTLTMGSFLAYHVYLVSTNQTTLEHMSPYMLLRYLPGSASPHPQASFPPIPRLPQPHPPPPSSPHARPKPPTTLASPPTPPTSLSPPLSPPPSPASHFPPTPPPALARTPAARDEHDLSHAQRRIVRHAHARVRPYDLGVRRNWAQVWGGGGWARALLWGGAPRGDGRVFERGRGVCAALDRLARELDDVARREDGGCSC